MDTFPPIYLAVMEKLSMPRGFVPEAMVARGGAGTVGEAQRKSAYWQRKIQAASAGLPKWGQEIYLQIPAQGTNAANNFLYVWENGQYRPKTSLSTDMAIKGSRKVPLWRVDPDNFPKPVKVKVLGAPLKPTEKAVKYMRQSGVGKKKAKGYIGPLQEKLKAVGQPRMWGGQDQARVLKHLEGGPRPPSWKDLTTKFSPLSTNNLRKIRRMLKLGSVRPSLRLPRPARRFLFSCL